MRIGLIPEGDFTGTTVEARYHEMIEEAVLADRLGYEVFGTSEQHFFPPKFSVAAPEVLYAAIAMRTEQIKLRPMVVVPLTWNHPVVIAERLGALDIISKGRAELCTGRSNNLNTLRIFGVDPSKTREIWSDSMSALQAIFENPDAAEYHGEYWDFQEAAVVPSLVGKRYPKLSVAASSVESHAVAAKRGLGVISFDNYFGYDYLQECIDAYRANIAKAPGAHVNNFLGLTTLTVFCAPTEEKAREIAGAQAMSYFQQTIEIYAPLAKNRSYEYMDRITEMIANGDNLDWLLESTPTVMVGTPDTLIRKLKDLEGRGLDEVVLRIDSFGHQNHMDTIELIGKEVLPEFH